jgi:nitroreductase
VEFDDVVRRRRMVRNFAPQPVDPDVLDRLLDLARRAPSAGNTQGCEFVVLEGPDETARFWDVTFPAERRRSFRWPGLFGAPVIVVPVVSRALYLDRYREPDKAAAGLGDPTRWPVPYWFIDGGMATMTLLHAAVDAGLGALFFGIFAHEDALLSALGVPDEWRALGAVAIGHPRDDEPGRSATRGRRPLEQVVHRGGW